MSYPVSYVHLLSVSSALWLGVGGTGKGIWYKSEPTAKVMKDVFVTREHSNYPSGVFPANLSP